MHYFLIGFALFVAGNVQAAIEPAEVSYSSSFTKIHFVTKPTEVRQRYLDESEREFQAYFNRRTEAQRAWYLPNCQGMSAKYEKTVAKIARDYPRSLGVSSELRFTGNPNYRRFGGKYGEPPFIRFECTTIVQPEKGAFVITKKFEKLGFKDEAQEACNKFAEEVTSQESWLILQSSHELRKYGGIFSKKRKCVVYVHSLAE